MRSSSVPLWLSLGHRAHGFTARGLCWCLTRHPSCQTRSSPPRSWQQRSAREDAAGGRVGGWVATALAHPLPAWRHQYCAQLTLQPLTKTTVLDQEYNVACIAPARGRRNCPWPPSHHSRAPRRSADGGELLGGLFEGDTRTQQGQQAWVPAEERVRCDRPPRKQASLESKHLIVEKHSTTPCLHGCARQPLESFGCGGRHRRCHRRRPRHRRSTCHRRRPCHCCRLREENRRSMLSDGGEAKAARVSGEAPRSPLAVTRTACSLPLAGRAPTLALHCMAV